MEDLLAGKPKNLVIDAMRALLDPLIQYWGDSEGFAAKARPLLVEAAKGVLNEDEISELLGPLYQQVLRMRALYFRPLTAPLAVDGVLRELEATASENNATGQMAALWLASRAQLGVINYLRSPEGRQGRTTLFSSVEERRQLLQGELGAVDKLTLRRANTILIHYVRGVLGEELSRIHTAALSGYLLEVLRDNAKKAPELGDGAGEAPESSVESAMLSMMTEPVRMAELNDARLRFTQYNDDERSRRFNDFRLRMARVIQDVAPYAPLGLETLYQAIEASLFPYPQPVDYIRPFARPIYTNGSQSTLFGDCTTPQSVEQRYEALFQGRQVNPLILEIAKAFALHAFKSTQETVDKSVLINMDLAREFGWPHTMDDLRRQMPKPGKAED